MSLSPGNPLASSLFSGYEPSSSSTSHLPSPIALKEMSIENVNGVNRVRLSNGKLYDITVRSSGRTVAPGMITKEQAQRVADLLNEAAIKKESSEKIRESLAKSDVTGVNIRISTDMNKVTFRVNHTSESTHQEVAFQPGEEYRSGINKSTLKAICEMFLEIISRLFGGFACSTVSSESKEVAAHAGPAISPTLPAAASTSTPAASPSSLSLSSASSSPRVSPSHRPGSIAAVLGELGDYEDIAGLDIEKESSQKPDMSVHEDVRALQRRLPKKALERALNPRPLVQQYKASDGTTYAAQIVSREPTITRAAEYARSNVERLQKELHKASLSARDRELIQVELNHYNRIARNAERYQKESEYKSAGCNYFRHLIWDSDFDTAVDNYVPALPNARTTRVVVDVRFRVEEAVQSAEVKEAAAVADRKVFMEREDSSSLLNRCTVAKHFRVGVMHDERQGFFSLRFIGQLLTVGDGVKAPLILAESNHIVAVLTKNLKNLKIKVKITDQRSLDAVISQLRKKIVAIEVLIKQGASGEKILDLKSQRNRLQSGVYALSQLSKMNLSSAGLEEVHTDRKLIMRDKMLLLVVAQVRLYPELLKDGYFPMDHIGAIEAEMAKLDPTGWMHDEGQAMEDMAEIYRYFDNTPIRFTDIENPYFNELSGEKVIYLPLRMNPVGAAAEFRLSAVFMNVGVQTSKKLGLGNTPNRGPQLEINLHALERLRSIGADDPKFKPFIDTLNDFNTPSNRTPKNGSYTIAKDLILGSGKAKRATSIGCASCKDRGGVLAAMHTQHTLENYVKTHDTNPKLGMSRALKKQFFEDILRPSSMTAHIIFEQTGIAHPKVFIPGIYGLKASISLGITVGMPALKSAKIKGNLWENYWKEYEARRLELAYRLELESKTKSE